mmetsp:Transcript_47613/g.101919  ORF Transcript_47613/g.101919 Transcript_47613/m.101919 type:complete len:220 (-) Transcript_47613:48-707(-)|eukprot:CAMPEP_0206535564 /NCGR_PEP_ID=MMETSP0325_2-20121206/6215_1 /ASSEMBLY_ACC=CAM_ASM_000347 /TAXON_ID=2866 /ORGANISM="Crypthecodinium cohnii, Strain Seligo" /LENGTH=219 /DNA_ID=CAMNT_0054032581 /DNA_START=58 /DNA_END=717 /DNA_ORIENTATION=+
MLICHRLPQLPRLLNWTLLLVAVLNLIDGAKAAIIADQEARKACPHYQQMQCMLDISEKACEPDEDPLPLVQWHAQESVWLCCCPLPYKPCHVSAMDKTCMSSVQKHLATTATSRPLLVEGLQRVRGELRTAGGAACDSLAKEQPLSVCGHEAKPPQKRSLAREDLFCEMLTWQLEELGDGDPGEFKRNGCTYSAKHKASQAKGSKRKGGRLKEPKPEL